MVFGQKSAEKIKVFYEKLINYGGNGKERVLSFELKKCRIEYRKFVNKKFIKIRKTFEKNRNLCYDYNEGIST